MAATINLVNGDSRSFWQGAKEGRLLLQKCQSCGAVQFPPRHHCATCWEVALEDIESSGHGTVESFTIVHRAPTPAFRDKVPYVVAAILVEEGPRMITSLVGDDAMGVAIGDPVAVDFAADEAGQVLPRFRRR